MRTLAICVLAGAAVARAQISVDETATRSKLVNGETRIYLALNSGFPKAAAVRVKLEWLDTDNTARHHLELHYMAPRGKSAVEARLGFNEKDDALFCRLRYTLSPDTANLTAFQPQFGILSFPNIAEHAFILSAWPMGNHPRPGAPYEF